MLKVLTLVGPTGVGKTESSVRLAEEFGLEIISADSRQVYKYLDIGTAKPSLEIRRRIPFHLIDIVTPDLIYSAADFSRDCWQVMRRLTNEGKQFIIVGGSGLYIKAVFEPFFPQHFLSSAEQMALSRDSFAKESAGLYERLKAVDPISAQRIHPNDRQRIKRALEVFLLTGIPLSEHIAESRKRKKESEYAPLYLGLTMERQELYKRIDKRVTKMFEEGFVDEVKSLLGLGYSEDCYSFNAVGYREVFQYLRGLRSLSETIELIKRRSRNYAKRQLTWFRKVKGITWLEYTTPEETFERIKAFYLKHFR